ncbi:hypothetical protein PR001_g2761 [Phytophthora rubi]|uniref:HTH CENPB-type domain-containing protein n=1 Tax=Phytophthora rubi TaxID=129364 RepID=A0A6A3NZE8_9STRA|nr:hypothetical protein PR001_g2761 [Phytophthora rubi]
MLHSKALDFAEQAGLSRQRFTASWAWRKGFIKRHRLSFRARTRQEQKSPEDSAKAVEELNKTMKETMHKLDIQEAYNADQTPIFFEYIPKQTLNARGAPNPCRSRRFSSALSFTVDFLVLMTKNGVNLLP